MFKFLVRRLLQLIPVIIGVTLIVFSLMHFIPGDPAQVLAGESATPQQIEAINERLGLNDPYPVQYFRYMTNLVQFDLGNSLRNGQPVSDLILQRIGITLELSIYSTILSIFLGLIAGVLSATKRGSFRDSAIMVLALFGMSMPNFWLGLVLIQWFALGNIPFIGKFIDTAWFPPSGWGSFEQLVLPVFMLGISGAAIVARMTRSSMLEVINQDYIRTARAKGVRERIVIYQHALKNALIPVITVVGLSFGSLLGGAVLAESVFAINGMGRLIYDAINNRDFPVMQGGILVASLLFVLVNLLVDIAYRFVNKRVETE
ncbi:ABC transporter permease [Shouchella clausii]|jgi:peptide/nickel transport system permease protein|uniref:Oligopeptide ABC transporter permease n=6 Tax=Bacillaceae TaxID=186817 RepID=Q5WM01_SHOC1|nr:MULTISPECIES: ABC transporter permease [Shouchella]MCM3314959.1 ABC transporter permease [Psychrobacillus sp. MER TA 17]PAD41038.1 ABC transporter permease [Bacillus sp. 7520-S]SPU18432.1 oligopeptide ABC transporter permease [Niallia circulans]ALA52854.1 Dipeptide transport system permease protein DppB [Shouchella clausii]AST95606.1 peptide ABC transporter permease [Shouchella clausii]